MVSGYCVHYPPLLFHHYPLLHQQKTFAFWSHLPTLATCSNSNKQQQISGQVVELHTFWTFGCICTRRIFLYKPGSLTFLVFFSFFSIFYIHFLNKIKSKYQKVTLNDKKCLYSLSGKGEIKALKEDRDVKRQFQIFYKNPQSQWH